MPGKYDDVLKDDPGWGVTAARFNLGIARIAALHVAEVPDREHRHEWYLHYGAFFTYLWAALQALKNYDGVRDKALGAIQKSYFETHIKGTENWKLIKDERDAVGHALPGVAYNPEWPLDMIARHGGLDALFEDFPPPWPDGRLKGKPLPEVLNVVWRQVSDWIDAVDAEDAILKSRENAGPSS